MDGDRTALSIAELSRPPPALALNLPKTPTGMIQRFRPGERAAGIGPR
jgi:hypothetical protein